MHGGGPDVVAGKPLHHVYKEEALNFVEVCFFFFLTVHSLLIIFFKKCTPYTLLLYCFFIHFKKYILYIYLFIFILLYIHRKYNNIIIYQYYSL
jgi:hypothetical protein